MSPYQVFLNSLRSSATLRAYKTFFKKYEEFMGENDLLCENNPRLVEEKIIEFIISLREKGLSHSAIRNYVFCVISFYKINDIMLNTTKISKFLPEYKKMKKDRAYKHEEIQKLLDIADERLRAVVLLLASTGMRIGAIPELRLRNLEDTKITIYEGTKDEYFTFITPECKEAIDSYLDMRKRHGENITSDSFLIREQFDIRKPSEREPKQTVANTLYGKLRDLSNRSGVRDKTLPVANGFRKFFTTQLENSGVNPLHGLMLEGHSTGIRDHYVRPTEQKMLDEYMKAVNNLTINEEHRLKIKVQLLESEKTNYEKLDAKIDELSRKFLENNVSVGITSDDTRPMTEEEIQHILNRRRSRDNAIRRRDKRVQDL